MNLPMCPARLFPLTDTIDHGQGVWSLCFGNYRYGLHEDGNGYVVSLPGRGRNFRAASCWADAIRICRSQYIDDLALDTLATEETEDLMGVW